jgi:putative transcription antitermination factor YqgF
MKKSMGSPNVAETSLAPYHSNSSGSANSEKTQEKEEELVPGTFLGIDFGKSKIGLAIADEETRMAFAFDTLENNAGFLDNLKEIIRCENVKTIVAGMAKHEKDEQGSLEKKAFAQMIEKETNIPVVFQDEMFTTKMAQENIKKMGGRKIAQSDDEEAARILLQDWLDKNQTG